MNLSKEIRCEPIKLLLAFTTVAQAVVPCTIGSATNAAPQPEKAEAAPSGWKRRPSSLVCASFIPSRRVEGKGRSFWLVAPWGHALAVLGRVLRGHLKRCEWSVDWRGGPLRADQRTNPGYG